MRKLIEVSQEYDVVCDNVMCDYVVKNEAKGVNEAIGKHLNAPCPKCGENLLTEEDMMQYLAMHKLVNKVNKWFSWITIFIKEPKKRSCVEMHVHEGVKFSKKE